MKIDVCQKELFRGVKSDDPLPKINEVDRKISQISTFFLRILAYQFSLFGLICGGSLLIGVRGQNLNPFPPTLDVDTLNLTDGFVIFGENNGDHFGSAVSSAGDLNGDGWKDFMVGAEGARIDNIKQFGKVYVFFGGYYFGYNRTFELSHLNGTNGFTIFGEQYRDFLGHSLSNIGDVNQDGFDDIILGAHYASRGNKQERGLAYVIFGHKEIGMGGSLNLTTLDGSDGFVIYGEALDNRLGSFVTGGGDLNGDNITDIVVAAERAAVIGAVNTGKVYVLFGSKTLGLTGTFQLSNLDGTNGFKIFGIDTGSYLGSSLFAREDLNSDGLDDLFIGAYIATPLNRGRAGKIYAIFGAMDIGKSGMFSLSGLNGTNGFVIAGGGSTSNVGSFVSSPGDINGDQIPDLFFGSRLSLLGRSYAGTLYVLFGSNTLGESGLIDIVFFNETKGIIIHGDQPGGGVGTYKSAGDLNGDGNIDIFLKTGSKGLILFGGETLRIASEIDLRYLNQTVSMELSTREFNDYFGSSAASIGDMNLDGMDDLILGAWQADPPGFRNSAGKAYVIYGKKEIIPSTTSSTLPSTLTSSKTMTEQQTTSTIASHTSSTSSSLSTLIPTINQTGSVSMSSQSNPFVSVSISSMGLNPLYLGIAGGGSILCICTIAGVAYLILRNKKSSSDEAAQQNKPIQNPESDYVAIDSLMGEMQSARYDQPFGQGQPKNEYTRIEVRNPNSHYNEWPSKPVPNDDAHYNKVSLTELNQAQMGYDAAKFEEVQANYDDLNIKGEI